MLSLLLKLAPQQRCRLPEHDETGLLVCRAVNKCKYIQTNPFDFDLIRD